MPNEPSIIERIFREAESCYQQDRRVVIEVPTSDAWDLIDDMHRASGYLVTLEGGTKYVLPRAVDIESNLGLIPYVLTTMQRLLEEEGIRNIGVEESFQHAAMAMACSHLSIDSVEHHSDHMLAASYMLEQVGRAINLVSDMEDFINRCCDLLGADAILFTVFTPALGDKVMSDLRRLSRIHRLTVLFLSPSPHDLPLYDIPAVMIR